MRKKKVGRPKGITGFKRIGLRIYVTIPVYEKIQKLAEEEKTSLSNAVQNFLNQNL